MDYFLSKIENEKSGALNMEVEEDNKEEENIQEIQNLLNCNNDEEYKDDKNSNGEEIEHQDGGDNDKNYEIENDEDDLIQN